MGRRSAASASGPCVDSVYIPAGAAVPWPVYCVALQSEYFDLWGCRHHGPSLPCEEGTGAQWIVSRLSDPFEKSLCFPGVCGYLKQNSLVVRSSETLLGLQQSTLLSNFSFCPMCLSFEDCLTCHWVHVHSGHACPCVFPGWQ